MGRHSEKEHGSVGKGTAELGNVGPRAGVSWSETPQPQGGAQPFLERNKESKREMHRTQTTVTNHC